MRDVTEGLVEVAREAGAELRRRFGAPRVVEKKGVIDLVTDADRAAEEIVLNGLARLFPGAPVLSEEAGARAGGGTLRFIVDPLDGTTNYAHGVPHFSVTVAADDADGILSGVVYDPLREELYVATRGRGATCNGAPLRVSQNVVLDDAVLATGLPYDVRTRTDDVLGLFSRLVKASRAVRRFGSAALDLAWVAHGRFDGYWERGLKPWDLAAGMLLVREAGGVAVDYRGAPDPMQRLECVAGGAGLVQEVVAFTRDV